MGITAKKKDIKKIPALQREGEARERRRSNERGANLSACERRKEERRKGGTVSCVAF